ncbi:MAG: serine racemase VanT catalytic subunit [Coriobacteriales bacterium]|jgi:serine/alanine racemase|nr:serine racemase VanT catalytic subunit [Coriobacteriales bacterium]
MPQLLSSGNTLFVVYLCFACLSVLVLVLVKLASRITRGSTEQPQRAWIVIDLGLLKHNVNIIRSLVDNECKLMPAIKGNAYGLGMVPIAKALWRFGVHDFCVASLSEGIELRKSGIRGNILILGYTNPDNWALLKKYRLTQTLVDYEYGMSLAACSTGLSVHIKVDTGMHRLGECVDQTDRICDLLSCNRFAVKGIFTQLSNSDSNELMGIYQNRNQLARFEEMLSRIQSQGIAIPETHTQNSYGIINYPQKSVALARPGLAIYGVIDQKLCINNQPDLRPIFEVRARVALTKHIATGECVGYGDGYVATEDLTIAVVTIGYADGFPRNLSNGRGGVLVRGGYAPVVGFVCMDQTTVDVSRIPGVVAGDIATIIGNDSDKSITISQIADMSNTISNEIMSRLGERLERRYVEADSQ